MTDKRALIVDDSRSARVILSRMLETHGLQVDTVESGEQALDYLRNARPDVVFMDHLMPGMDGFEAVRAMKNNARTQSIPVMMYTSQEGDAYLREARKVGAVGVLSKTLKPTDVSHALYELNLLPERREERVALQRRDRTEETVVQLAASSGRSAANVFAPHGNVSPQVSSQSDARNQAESQRTLQIKLDEFANRMHTELHAAIRQLPVTPSTGSTTRQATGIFAAALVIVALIPTAVLAFFYWRAVNDSKAQLEQSAARLAMVVTEQQTQIETLRSELRKHQESINAENNATAAPTQVIAVAYGELPLAGARVEQLRMLIDRLQAENFRGKIHVTTFIGDFCLSGSANKGFSLARESYSIRRCDLIGNPFEDALNGAQRQSVEFANLLAASKVPIEVEAGGRKPRVLYPEQTDAVIAGDWNRIAVQNNRVELSTLPAVSP